jgi:hypothetical protein
MVITASDKERICSDIVCVGRHAVADIIPAGHDIGIGYSAAVCKERAILIEIMTITKGKIVPENAVPHDDSDIIRVDGPPLPEVA